MEPVRLSWTTASVNDGSLSVELAGEVSKVWKKSFEHTLKLLAGKEWGTVEIKTGEVRVQTVAAGSEDRLRHFLESVVEQANADEEKAERQAAEAAETEEHDGEGESEIDQEMTNRFRSFKQG